MKFQRFSFSLLLQLKSGTKRDRGLDPDQVGLQVHDQLAGRQPEEIELGHQKLR